jgi:hypothetical protein
MAGLFWGLLIWGIAAGGAALVSFGTIMALILVTGQWVLAHWGAIAFWVVVYLIWQRIPD